MGAKTLGIVGGGQLGRMSAQAAAKLGIKTVIFTPEGDSPAGQAADETVIGAYEDQAQLTVFAGKADVISYEFENIPVETVRYLQVLKPVYPDLTLLKIAQDRIREKSYLNSIDIPTAKWIKIHSISDIEEFKKDNHFKFLILKTTRFGYDGKGQAFIGPNDQAAAAFALFKNQEMIAEEVIDFDCEISVIVARGQDGQIVSYGPQLNEHKNHILYKTTYPAPIDENIRKQAIDMAENLARRVELIGVLGLEMFVTKDGRLLANEIAPRTHNSGHWTIEGCATSQFENHVRAVCGLPLGPAQPRPATMINLIGDDVNNLSQYEGDPNARIHLYGKAEIRPGRKMGHITIVGE